MLTVSRFSVENLTEGCVTDVPRPRFSFALESTRQGASLQKATLRLNGWEKETAGQIAIPYEGAPLRPFTRYTALLEAEDDAGERATAQVSFETGRLTTPWNAKWISDPTYRFTEKGISPVPMVFRKQVRTGRAGKAIVSAKICATALG
ncbi:MAG: alpha-L-rhamnosidase, partial [bacterium]